ncbi:hypothetical protein KK062_15150 [Fulvivirgaceae bacterium PWU5]|uniref:Uncharacterized protein n=1 Tax=Dawidia cretensis TaxID=2782350 RepID=A0AAP2E0C3_9BACT|nr:hypothetical protein [Dawidia cretensis]MBT1709578.1 hypothetical protein [Dawidia cretensis]
MKSFIFKTLLYALPIALFLLVPYAVLEISGELDDFSKESLAPGEILGLAYSDQARDYKLQQILHRKPEVLALGTSRIMQVREFFFQSNVRFFNGGGVIANIGDLACLSDEFKRNDYHPAFILLSLDQNFFNANWDDMRRPCHYNRTRRATELFTSSLKKVYTDLYDHKIDLGKVFHTPGHVGLNAIMNGNGFRYDGSYRYGKTVEKVFRGDTVSFVDVEKRIKRGINKFEWCYQVNPEAINVLLRFVTYCEQNDIGLVMFFPPYPDQVYQQMVTSGKYDYLSKLDSAMEHHHLRVHNFSSLKRLDATDREAVDGFHGSEVAYLRLVQALCARGEHTLEKYIDKSRFGLLNAPASPVELIRKK